MSDIASQGTTRHIPLLLDGIPARDKLILEYGRAERIRGTGTSRYFEVVGANHGVSTTTQSLSSSNDRR